MAFLVLAALLAAGPGCGEGPPAVSSSRTEAKVRGKVVIRGKAATKGVVVFDPANIHRRDVAARTVNVGPDGSYEITTLVGENSVRYEGPSLRGSRELEGMALSTDVKEGENQYDIILPPQ